jgi:hypothetical protein
MSTGRSKNHLSSARLAGGIPDKYWNSVAL